MQPGKAGPQVNDLHRNEQGQHEANPPSIQRMNQLQADR
jgi:hypothetical protein